MNTVHGMSKIEFIRTDAISLISEEKKNDCASEGCVASVAPKLESTPIADEWEVMVDIAKPTNTRV